MTVAEATELRARAAAAGITVPRLLLESALHPSKANPMKDGPWLPWPQRQALGSVLLSAASELAEVRLTHLSSVGSNLNQLTRAANVDGIVGEEIVDLLQALRELVEALDARATRIEQLAQEVQRR